MFTTEFLVNELKAKIAELAELTELARVAVAYKADGSLRMYADDKLAAVLLGKNVQSLRNDRSLGRGLPYYKIGPKSVRYSLEDIAHYLEGCRVNPDGHQKDDVRSHRPRRGQRAADGSGWTREPY